MSIFNKLNIIKKQDIPVSLMMDAPIEPVLLTGDAGLSNKITGKHIHRPQLALVGFVEFINYKNVQMFGNTEIYYLESLGQEKRAEAFENVVQFKVPCIVITNNHPVSSEIINLAKSHNVALIHTPYETTKANALLADFLDDQFVERASVHGSFVDVYGVGILLTGRSGIGKSEIALDLVERGHRLVADDIVMVNKKNENTLIGTGTNLVQHFMEIRGVGIIDVRQMFGIRSIRFQKRLEIIVELEEWQKKVEYTRTGLDQEPNSFMGVNIPRVKLPIFAGKNVTVITEVIALDYLLKTYGYDAAEVLSQKLSEQMRKKSQTGFTDERAVNYFQGDSE